MSYDFPSFAFDLLTRDFCCLFDQSMDKALIGRMVKWHFLLIVPFLMRDTPSRRTWPGFQFLPSR
jgi:hypothetical protein